MEEKAREPAYNIGAVASIVGVHVQTLRNYERMGLVTPQRSPGRVRRYTAQDIERLRQVKKLVDDLGVNLAGVEVILHMREQMLQMEEEMRRLESRFAQLVGRRSLPVGADRGEASQGR